MCLQFVRSGTVLRTAVKNIKNHDHLPVQTYYINNILYIYIAHEVANNV